MEGSPQLSWMSMPQVEGNYITSTGGLPTVASVVSDLSEPIETVDLTTGTPCFLLKLDPYKNVAMQFFMYHHTLVDIAGQVMVFGLRERMPDNNLWKLRQWQREPLFKLDVQALGTLRDGANGLPASPSGSGWQAIEQASKVWDVTLSPQVRLVGNQAGGILSAVFDGLSYPRLLVYASCTKGGLGAAACVAITGQYTQF